MARYVEYPVSHTTGIPDITIPLYEIRVGEFTLPISVSYHASGAKTDEIPTCVGLGWALNAGGAISRSILGKPDLFNYSVGASDYTYYDEKNLKDLLADVSLNDGRTSELSSILHHAVDGDTESDRYTYNVAGKRGVFRYSYTDGRYIVINNSNDDVRSYGSTMRGATSFSIFTTDGLIFDFAQEEATGVANDFAEDSFVTTWYVTEIKTPWGNLTFTYEQAPSLAVHAFDVQATAGVRYEYVETEKGDWWYDEKYSIKPSQNDYYLHYGQKLLKKIEFNGNYVVFNYVDDNNYDNQYSNRVLHRLTKMEVYGSDDNLIKSVIFDNTDNWPTNDSLTGRRLLKSISDSQQGIWSFEYDKSANLPALPLGHSTACDSDLWGFMNTLKSSPYMSAFTDTQSEWLDAGLIEDSNLDESNKNSSLLTRNRDAVLQYAKAGVLKSITVPTGGKISYDYELNRFNGKNIGGLRVKTVSIYEPHTGKTDKTTYTYYGERATYESPEILTRYRSYEQQNRRSVLGAPPPTQFRTVSTNPILPATSSCSPVLYSSVDVTRPDGSSVTFHYDENELSELFGQSPNYTHPSLWDQSVMDFGIRDAILKEKIVKDPSGKEICRETYSYEKSRRSQFSTGVRTFWKYVSYNIPSTSMWETPSSPTRDIAHYGLIEYRTSYAYPRAVVLKSKTVKDIRTGFTTTTEYGYDSSFRTFLPVSESTTNSDGRAVRTVYRFPFDFSDNVSLEMTESGCTDFIVARDIMSGNNRLSTMLTSYGGFNNMFYPMAASSWSMPTKDQAMTMPAVLPERERVSAYNSLGRPLSITVNETDLTSLTWNERGNLLLSATAPGGLTTTYTHKPLLGLESATQPNGLKLRYEYNSICALSRVFDNLGCLDTYSYSIANHPTGDYTGNGNSIISRHYLTRDGLTRTIDQQYHDGLGRPSVLAKAGGSTSGKYLYSAVTYDNMGRELRSIMPAVGGTTIEAKTAAQVQTMASATYGDSYAYSDNSYDALDRIVKATTPGKAWHDAGEKGKVTEYVGNSANSVRLYSAPMNAISLVENGYYAASTLQGVRTLDEDGNEMTVYTDRLGRKVLERRGPESAKGQNDTYFVYNDLGQLRYVLSPGYELSGYKEKFAYEYRYDEHGNVVKKFIPGGGYTQYWYDRAGRMTFMQDENLRAQNQHRFFIYDRAGRQALQGTAAVCNRSSTVNFADYTGGTSGFQSTGYTLQDATRIQQVTLETVNYYDDYRFASALDSRLTQTAAVSAKGLGTGSVTYNSEGGKSMSAIYYDIRGNVTTLREITDFGTLRVTDNTYTFTNQPLTSKMTESGGVTMLTENTYDTGSGLLVATDVTINGTKQRVSKVTYDDLGRITSVVRGNGANSGGTVSYSYNLHGQTTSITGPGFTQKLHYTDGPGNPLYNGSISSMLWTMGSDATQRGYKYTYNRYNWLTLAEYGEGATLTTHKDRYTERFSSFMLNGGIRRLQRHGLKADGNYGKIDNLHISYDGNRITTVLEDADAVTQSGSMDYPGTKREMAFEYNAWGALIKDESRGIESIEYDNFGNPVHIDMKGRDYTKNVYSATGVKLKTEHYTDPFIVGPPAIGGTQLADAEPMDMEAVTGIIDPGVSQLAGQEKIEYRGPVIYRNGKIDMVLFPGGYATISGTAVTFRYYTQDYLGNNRAVVNGTTGTIEQTTAYYPYGAVIPDLGTGNTGQPFKFGGKELISANGLNMYDFGARLHYPAVPHFTSIDPLSEKYAWLSPYLYCANNPVNAIDPDGRSTWVTDMGDGRYKVFGGDINDHDKNVYVYTNDENGEPTVRGKSIGITATMYSFYKCEGADVSSGTWSKESIIDMNDNSGAEFLSDLANRNPPLVSDYMPNAQNEKRYDFKATNGTSGNIDGIDHYRGMQIGTTKDGVPILASARDVGNIGAGYIAAINGFSWNEARTAFDTYQSQVLGYETKEGMSTMTAEWHGFMMGRRSTSLFQRESNFIRSSIDAIKVGADAIKVRAKKYLPFLK